MKATARRATTLILLALTTSIGCPRASSPTPQQRPSRADAAPGVADASTDADAQGAAADEPSPRGFQGLLMSLDGGPASGAGTVYAVLPGTTEPTASATVDDQGRFELIGLSPETYRIVVPADGFHSTGSLYATLSPDAGVAELDIPRSRGCPVTITIRDHDRSTIAGAELELELTDLPQVPDRHVIRGTTDQNGRLIVTGSCVRGYFDGTLTVADRGEFPIYHGYVGTGRDVFDVVLPPPDQADAGVAYTNDD